MRFIVALLLITDVAMAQVQNRTYQDAIGRNTGRSVTDSRGNVTYYDAMGRTTGRATPTATPPPSTTRWVVRPAHKEQVKCSGADGVNTGHVVDTLMARIVQEPAGEAFPREELLTPARSPETAWAGRISTLRGALQVAGSIGSLTG